MSDQQRYGAMVGRVCAAAAYILLAIAVVMTLYALTEGFVSFLVTGMGSAVGIAIFYGLAVLLRSQEVRLAESSGRRAWTSGPLLDAREAGQRGQIAAIVLLVGGALFSLALFVLSIEGGRAFAALGGGGVGFGLFLVAAIQTAAFTLLVIAFGLAVRGAAYDLQSAGNQSAPGPDRRRSSARRSSSLTASTNQLEREAIRYLRDHGGPIATRDLAAALEVRIPQAQRAMGNAEKRGQVAFGNGGWTLTAEE